MNSVAPVTGGATVTVTGPGIVTGLINSGVDAEMCDAISTICGGGVGVGVGVGAGAQPKRILCNLNPSSGVVVLVLAATTSTLPTLFAALMSAQRVESVRVVLLSSRVPRLVRKASLNVLWLAIGFVFVPIHADMSL